MKKYLVIFALLFSACNDEELINTVKKCMNDIYKSPSNEVYDRCYYFENEFQRQLSINFSSVFSKLFENYNGIKDIQVDVVEKSKKSGVVNIITLFNNGIITNEKRKVIKLNEQWKISADTIK